MKTALQRARAIASPYAVWLLALCVTVIAACGSANAPPDRAPAASGGLTLDAFPAMASGPAPGASLEVLTVFRKLGRGINFGNMLESPREGDWGIRAEDRFIDLVGPGKFTQNVRLPVRWSNHASADAAAIINPAFFARVDYVVDRLLARGVVVILDMHHYRQFDGDTLDTGEAAVSADVVDVRFLSMWKQIAERYANRSDNLIFEIYNEPHGRLETRWNDLFSRALRVVRQSNPKRAVVVGPTEYNGARKLPDLRLPADPHLILTVHNYDPFDFTHQGAEWVVPQKPTGVTCCSDAQKQDINRSLDLAAGESKRVNYPVFVGEFGAYSKAPEASRVAYSRFMREAMEARGLPWFYWELASGFGVYDPASNRFRESLYTALYGP